MTYTHTVTMSARDVRVEIDGAPIVHGIDLEAHAGELLVIAGPNGAGKSTLLEAIAGVRAFDGSILRPARLAFVPQRTSVTDALPMSVGDVVRMGAWRGLFGPSRPRSRMLVRAALAAVDAEELAPRAFASLSGGQRQRVLLAQGIARRADLVLLDEPTTGLDDLSVARIDAAINAELARGACVICVSHERRLLQRADRTLALEQGRVALLTVG